MKLFSLYRVELRRMCHSKMFWQTAFLSLCAPLLGYSVYEPARPDIMAGHYIANPVLAGTAAGAVLWMAFALFEADRPRRSGTDVLAESVVSPVYLPAAGMGAELTLSAAVTIACALLYLPYTAKRMDYLFGAGFYFENFLVFMLLTWWVSILLADALYYITNRVELAAACYAGLAYPGLGFGFGERDYFVRWLNPMVISYSDGFPSLWPLRVGLYSRGIWLCLGLGGFLFSLLCIRRYRKGLVASVAAAFRKPGPAKAYLPVSAAAIAAAGIFLWIYQPFVDHGPESVVYRAMEKDAYVKTATYAHFSINTEPVSGKVFGRAEYQLPVPYSGESVLRLNSGYRITGMTYDGWPVPFRTVEEDVNGDRPTYFTVQGDYGKNLVIEYEGIPAAAKSTARYRVTDTVDYDYIALGGQALLPWMENYWCRESTLEITIPGGLTPFVNYGLMEECVDNGNGTKTWSCADVNYIMDFTAGHYVVERLSMEGMEIDFAYGESYQEAVEEYHVKQAVLDVFDYGNRHYGEMEFLDDGRLLLLQRSAMFSGGPRVPECPSGLRWCCRRTHWETLKREPALRKCSSMRCSISGGAGTA